MTLKWHTGLPIWRFYLLSVTLQRTACNYIFLKDETFTAAFHWWSLDDALPRSVLSHWFYAIAPPCDVSWARLDGRARTIGRTNILSNFTRSRWSWRCQSLAACRSVQTISSTVACSTQSTTIGLMPEWRLSTLAVRANHSMAYSRANWHHLVLFQSLKAHTTKVAYTKQWKIKLHTSTNTVYL